MSGSSLLFFFKCIFLSVFKISNFLTLFHRFITIGIVIVHYSLIEGIDYLTQAVRENEVAFLWLIAQWHFVFMNLKVAEESFRKKHESHQNVIMGIAFFFGIPTLLILLLTPFFSWFDSDVTRLESSYYTLRYTMIFLYIVLNTVISVFPHMRNFLFFLSDGVILSQLTSLYLYNEFSMSAMLTALPVLFVLHNHLLVRGIQKFVKNEQEGKMTFVRLIGRHDSVFLFVIYSLFTTIFTLVDVFASDWKLAANLWYIVYALYAFAKLMDHKQSQSKWLRRLSFFTVLIFIGVYCWSVRYHANPFPNREFPLYRQPLPGNETLDGNSTTNSTELNYTISNEITSGEITSDQLIVI